MGNDCRWMGCGTHGWFELVQMVGRVRDIGEYLQLNIGAYDRKCAH